MSFTIDFVGLSYFQKQNGSLLVLLPDGRDFEGMTRHDANFYIEKARLIGRPDQQEWWDPIPNKVLEMYSLVQFPIPKPVRLEITGLESPPGGSSKLAVEPVRMDQVEHLKALDPEIEINTENPNTIARLGVGQGRLEAFSLRSRAPVVRLLVNHTGKIRIKGITGDGKTYTLTLRDEAEIVLANTPELFKDEGTQTGMHAMPMSMSHYVIYEQLAKNPDVNRMKTPPPNKLSTLPDFPSSQAFFVLLDGQTPNGDCGPTCC